MRIAVLSAALFVASAQPALAHDCSSPRDCEQTAGYNAVVALAGGALALASGLFGSAIAKGNETPAEPDAGAQKARKRRGCCLGWFTMITSIPIALLALVMRAVGLL